MNGHELGNGLQDAVQEAASKLEEDLRWRGLSAGERYISAEEAGELLGVSMATADRAMRLLTEKGILIRQRGRGTFVGSVPSAQVEPGVKSIQILMPRLNESLGMSLEETIRGVHKVYPDVPVTINAFSSADPLPALERMLNAGGGNGGVMGVGMILVPRQVQEIVAERKIPAVLLGTPYIGVKGVVSIDVNHHRVGNLIASHLLERGHSRFGMLLRESVPPGDTAMMNGLTEALGESGVTCDALTVRHCTMQRDCVRETIRELLTSPNRPTALIGYPYPEEIRWVMETADEIGMTLGKDFEYVTGLGATTPSPARCPARCCLSPDEVGERFGRMLARVANGESISPPHQLLPVELV